MAEFCWVTLKVMMTKMVMMTMMTVITMMITMLKTHHCSQSLGLQGIYIKHIELAFYNPKMTSEMFIDTLRHLMDDEF